MLFRNFGARCTKRSKFLFNTMCYGLLTPVVFLAGCENENVVQMKDGAIVVTGVIRDKNTLELLDGTLVGVVYPYIPEGEITDSLAFLNKDVVLEFFTKSRETGEFIIHEFPSTCGDYYECAIKRINRLIAWTPGYRFWKFNARRDTVSRSTPLNVSIYLEKQDD